MKLDNLRTYKTAFQMLSTTLIVVVVISLLSLSAMAFFLYDRTLTGFHSVWIVDPKSKESFRADIKSEKANPEREYEYINHVFMFYKNWYEYDQYTYQNHIEHGLNLIGNSGKTMLNDNKTYGIERKLLEKNLKITISVDSTFIDMNSTPVRGITYATQTIESPAGKVQRRQWAKYNLYDLEGRSNENPHGCILENFVVFDGSKIESK